MTLERAPEGAGLRMPGAWRACVPGCEDATWRQHETGHARRRAAEAQEQAGVRLRVRARNMQTPLQRDALRAGGSVLASTRARVRACARCWFAAVRATVLECDHECDHECVRSRWRAAPATPRASEA
eukprot:4506491-Pleurochrysis_carterae.AAC.8